MRKMHLKKASIAVAAILGLTACANTSAGEPVDGKLPSGTITIVVPFGAGGSLDTNARIFAECLSDNTDSKWVVENREGGGGVSGVNHLLDSTPDGTTVGYVSSSGMALTPLQVDNAEYTVDDVAPLATVTAAPSVVITSSESGIATLEDLLESNGSEKTLATTGSLGIYQMVAESLSSEANVRPVPFDGAAAATTAALGENVDGAVLELDDSLIEQVKNNKLSIVGTGSEKELSYLPEVETLTAAGYEVPSSTNYGLFIGSPEIPDETQEALESEFLSCASQEDVAESVGQEFILNEPYDRQDTADLLKEISDEYESQVN